MTPTSQPLTAWLAFALILDQIYREELDRSCFSDTEAFVNWTYWWRDGGATPDQIRSMIQGSPEWRAKHGGAAPGPVPVPIPAPPLPDPHPAQWGVPTSSTDTTARPRFTPAQMASFVPTRTGPFQVPAPYHTPMIRLTTAADGEILPVGYSDRPNVNRHAGRPELYVFLGTGAGTPILLRVNKASGQVTNLGPIGIAGTGELWYFSALEPLILYAYTDARFRRYNVETRAEEVVFSLSADQVLWQMSSSDDGQTHVGTMRSLPDYLDAGIVVWRRGVLQVLPLEPGYDECEIDKSGRWLVIKCGNGGADNLVIDLDSGERQTVTNAAGAVGHSDTGDGVVIGEDDQHEPCALVRWDLQTLKGRELLYHTPQWVDEEGRGIGLGHVAVRGSRLLVSQSHPTELPRVNELILVNPDGSGNAVAIAPNLTFLQADEYPVHYPKQTKANVDPSGAYFCMTADLGTGSLDAFLGLLP